MVKIISFTVVRDHTTPLLIILLFKAHLIVLYYNNNTLGMISLFVFQD